MSQTAPSRPSEDEGAGADRDTPALGSRENFWGEDGHDVEATGHQETSGTDPAEHIAFRHLLELVDPICDRSLGERGEEIELTEPTMYLPKQHDAGTHIVDYGQHRHRRRVNPETGYINWGETTSTGLPQVDEGTFLAAVENFLFDRLCDDVAEAVVLTDREIRELQARKQRARRLFRDQHQDSHGALETFVRQVREGEI